jgi:hypothetical protein
VGCVIADRPRWCGHPGQSGCESEPDDHSDGQASDGTDPAAHVAVIAFGKMIVVSAAKTYAVRVAAVFMISLATIWLTTGLMPRWLVAVSYLVALGLLIAGDVSMWLTLAFPVWVLVVSALILLRAGYIAKQRAALE